MHCKKSEVKKSETFKVGFGYIMPRGQMLEIRCNTDTRDLDIELDEQIEGILYYIFWEKEPLHWSFNTEMQAMMMALGCQYGANETLKRML